MWRKITKDCGKGELFWRVAIAAKSDKPQVLWSDHQRFYFYQDALDRINLTKKVIVGVASSYEGNFLKGDMQGGFKGFNMDFATELVKNLIPDNSSDLDVVVKMFGWPEIFNGLKNKRVDMIIAGVSITEDRKLHYGIIYSEPYFQTTLGVILRDKEFDLETTEKTLEKTLIGKIVSVRSGTTSVDLARELNTKVIEVSSMAVAFDNVKTSVSYGAIMDEEFAHEKIALHDTG